MRRELESKTASTTLYFVLILLILIKIEARDHNEVKCSSSSSCGEIRNISYPFRLKGDPSGCGDPDYELSCVNNRTILEIFPGKYYVYNISYDDQTLRLVDANFADANATCNLPSSSIESTDGFVQDFRFRGVVPKMGSHGVVPNPGSRFRFVKCSTNISSLPEAANYTTVPCLTTNGTYFYAVYDGEYSYFNAQPSCSVVSIAPVDLRHNITYKFPSYGAVVELLQAGFEVGWSVKCRDCSLAGKGCIIESWDTKPLTYICERENKELTRTEIILIIVAIAVGGLIGLVVIIVVLVFVIRKCRKRRNEANNSRKNLSQ